MKRRSTTPNKQTAWGIVTILPKLYRFKKYLPLTHRTQEGTQNPMDPIPGLRYAWLDYTYKEEDFEVQEAIDRAVLKKVQEVAFPDATEYLRFSEVSKDSETFEAFIKEKREAGRGPLQTLILLDEPIKQKQSPMLKEIIFDGPHEGICLLVFRRFNRGRYYPLPGLYPSFQWAFTLRQCLRLPGLSSIDRYIFNVEASKDVLETIGEGDAWLIPQRSPWDLAFWEPGNMGVPLSSFEREFGSSKGLFREYKYI